MDNQEFNFEKFKSDIENLETTGAAKKILDDELLNRGIDWRKFYDGDVREHTGVNELLNKLNTDLVAEDLLTNTDKVSDIVNLAFINEGNKKVIDYIQGLRGKDIDKYLVYITQKLIVIEKQQSATEIGVSLLGGGIMAIGAQWAVYSIKAFKDGATLLGSIVSGVRSFGVTVAVQVVILVLVLVLIPFLVFMDKAAQLLTLIVNRTSSSINITEYYFNHGKLVQQPMDYDPDKFPQKVSINAGIKDITDKKEKFEIAYGGLMFTSKRSKALIGMMGAIRMSFNGGRSQFPDGVCLGFKVPLASGNNDCQIAFSKGQSAKDFYKKQNDHFKLGNEVKEGKRLLQTNMGNYRGGEIYMISVVQEL